MTFFQHVQKNLKTDPPCMDDETFFRKVNQGFQLVCLIFLDMVPAEASVMFTNVATPSFHRKFFFCYT
jgi:hypothetical protein